MLVIIFAAVLVPKVIQALNVWPKVRTASDHGRSRTIDLQQLAEYWFLLINLTVYERT